MHRIDAAYCYGRCTFRDGSVGLCVSVSVCTPMNSATTDKPTCRSGADSKETIRKEVDIGATWQIRLNDPCVTHRGHARIVQSYLPGGANVHPHRAMRPCVKLL